MGIKNVNHLFGLTDLFKEYVDYLKSDTDHHRCKIIGVEKQSEGIRLLVQIRGVKNHSPIHFTPKELIVHDALLKEFSQTDVRAIAYYAFHSKNDFFNPDYVLVSQEFLDGKTVFVYKARYTDLYFRKKAIDLAHSPSLLKKFSFDEARKIMLIGGEEGSVE